MKNQSNNGGGRNPNPILNNHELNIINNKKQKTSNNETAIIPKCSLLMTLPLSLRMIILNLLAGSTQEELRNLPLVSKEFKNYCYQDEIEWKFIPLLELGRSSVNKKDNNEENDNNSIIGRKIDTFEFHISTNPEKFQHYVHMIVHNLSTFTIGTAEVRNTKLNGILSLDLYSQTRYITNPANDEGFSKLLSSIVPNLHELNVKPYVPWVLQHFIENCRNLEKVAITKDEGDDVQFLFDLNGTDFQMATNLKELYIDGVQFTSPRNECNGMFTLLDPNIPHEIPDDEEYDAEYCILHWCHNSILSLERLSLTNTKYSTYDIDDDGDDNADNIDYFTIEEYNDEGTIPQSGLIKFIRNAPSSLCWFRSDLSKENRDMLRLEKPGIEFC